MDWLLTREVVISLAVLGAVFSTASSVLLPVASLAQSTYVLRIEATAGDETAQQWMAFRVVR